MKDEREKRRGCSELRSDEVAPPCLSKRERGGWKHGWGKGNIKRFCPYVRIPKHSDSLWKWFHTNKDSVHGQIWSLIRPQSTVIGNKPAYIMCVPWSMIQYVGISGTHKSSNSISKAVNSSIKQKVYSMVKQKRDHALLIILLSLHRLMEKIQILALYCAYLCSFRFPQCPSVFSCSQKHASICVCTLHIYIHLEHVIILCFTTQSCRTVPGSLV